MNRYPTERLYFRDIRPDDLPLVYAGLSHPKVIRHYGISFDSLEATREQMRWFANLEATQTGKWLALCETATDRFVGAGGFNGREAAHQKAEIGFWLLPEYWGNGYMTEAMPRLLEFGFQELDLHRIEGYVETDNHACRRAMIKLPFELEGVMRDCERKDDRWISVALYAALRPQSS